MDPITIVVAKAFAILALSTSPTPQPADFQADILNNCTPTIEVGTFIGCEGKPSPQEDGPAYAGIIWVDNGDTITVEFTYGP